MTGDNAPARKNLVQPREFFVTGALSRCPGFDGELSDDGYSAFGRSLREVRLEAMVK